MTIETTRLLLRPFTDADAADLYEYAKDPRVGPQAGWQPHKSVAESLEVIHSVFGTGRDMAIELKETGKVIGSAGFMDAHRTELPGPDDEIGYALSPAYWGQGLMPEAVRALQDYGFREMGLETIWCCHYDFNDKSHRVIEKCGFRYRSTVQQWVEAMGEEWTNMQYAITRAEWQALREREEG